MKYLLPATVLKLKSVHPQEWTAAVHEKLYSSVESISIMEAKIKFLSNNKKNLFIIYCILLRSDTNMAVIWYYTFYC